MHYTYNIENWCSSAKRLFLGKVTEFVKEYQSEEYKQGKNDGTSPYVEIDEPEYNNVKNISIKRMTHLTDKQQQKIISGTELLYKTCERLMNTDVSLDEIHRYQMEE